MERLADLPTEQPTPEEIAGQIALIEYLRGKEDISKGVERYIQTLKWLIFRPCGVESDS